MIFSRIIGFVLIVLLFPLLMVLALVIYIDGGRPILFKQKRIGIQHKLFHVYKFRTMKNGIPDIPTHLIETKESMYTKAGPVLRKLSLDELPQLINIIRGEMVFVGPRPALYNQDDLIKYRTEAGVHTLMPGVTGWAQINGRDELSIKEKVRFDKYYLNNQSLFLDLKIVVLTIHKVLKMSGVSH